MKEAAGEANMTVITIVLIGVVLGIGTLVVTNLMKNTQNRTNSMINECPAGTNPDGNGGCV